MAAFSHQHSHFLLNSPIFSSIKMYGSLEEGSNSINNNISSSSCFPYSSLCDHSQQIPPFDVEVHYVTEKQRNNADSSSIVVDLDGSNNSDHQVTQINKSIPSMDNKRKTRDGSCLSSAESKEPRVKKQRKCTQSMKEKEEMKKIKEEEKSKKQVLPPPTGYVHVRARRGEATDSHSLAERVRREKISERLKMLQTLVPGCDKVTSKALMLDEIINYVQSLQHQVEFLSMKLSTMSPMFYDFGGMELDSLMVKSEKPSSLVSSPLQSVQQPISIPSTSFADITTTFPTSNNYQLTNTFPTTSNYPLLDSPVSLLLQQGYKSNVFSQDLLWDGEEQKQRFSNQSDLTNLCSPFQ